MRRAKLLEFRGQPKAAAEGETDDEVMLGVARGDVAQLALLFDKHHRALFNFLLRMTGNRQASEDLVQDVFFRILKYRHTYREGIAFDRWMYRIAVNARRDLAKKHRPGESLDEEAHGPESTTPLPGEELSAEQERALLRRALARLPEDKRELLVLSRFQNLRQDQIAEILGVNVGAVKVRIHRALQDLKRSFHEISGGRVS